MLHLVLESFSSYLGIYVRDVMILVGGGCQLLCSGSFNNFEPCRVKFDLMIKQNKCSQALFDGLTSPVRVLAESQKQTPQVWWRVIGHNPDTTGSGAGMCLTTLMLPSSSFQKQKMLLFLLYHTGYILSSSHCRFHRLQSTVANG